MRRREFLKASAVAAAAGLLQACAREEIEYIEQAVRRSPHPPGASVWITSVCQQCPAGCGIRVRTVDGDAKKVEGNSEHPVNRGGVCALGQASLQELYNPDRVRSPLKRVGARGSGSFEPISWGQALEEAGRALLEALARDPRGIASISGSSSLLVTALLRRLAGTLGALPPAFCENPESEVERAAARAVLGIEGLPVYDIERSDYLLSIGASFVERWRSPVHYARALAGMKRGRPGRRGKLVHAEARMSLTAANADTWLPLRPGTEGTLARAVAGVILEEGLAPAADVARYRRLFPTDPPALDEAARVCDLPPERIRRVARELARADRGLVLSGGSAAAHRHGLFNVTAGLGLNLLLGNLGRPGGVFAPATLDLEATLSSGAWSTERTPLAELASRLRGESHPPVELLLVEEADPLHTLPESWGLAEVLERVPRIVSLASFLDDTTLHADLVLPVHTDLERFDLVRPEPSIGTPVVGFAQPAVEPVTDSRHPGDVLLALARMAEGPAAAAFPWSSAINVMETMVREALQRLPGGRGAEFWSYYNRALERGGVWEEGTPGTVPPGPAGPAPEPGHFPVEAGDPEHPFALLIFESVKTGDGRGANRPWLQELPDPLSTVMWDSWVEISTPDAERLGLRAGDRVRVSSARGSIGLPAVVSPAVRPGVVGVPAGSGHRDYGRYARGRGANPMKLVDEMKVEGTGAPAWAETRVNLTRVGSGRIALFGRGLRQVEDLPPRR